MPYTFSTEEYADMVFVLCVCDGNARAAAAEYDRRYPNCRIPNPKSISSTFNTLRQTGSLPSVRIQYERNPQHELCEEENILDAVERIPRASTRRLARRFGVSQSMAWRTLHENGLHPYHLQQVQHLQPGDRALRLQFCNWLNGNRQLYRLIMFCDEAQFTRDGVNNSHNLHVWADNNPRATIESNFQHRFSVNVWCGVLYDQLIGPFILLHLGLDEGHCVPGKGTNT